MALGGWYPTNLNMNDRGTISDAATGRYWYVRSMVGYFLERDDGELRRFMKRETAARAANRLNQGKDA
jgi:hypothetical protein